MFSSAESAHWVKGDVFTPASLSLGGFQEGVLSQRKGVALSVSKAGFWSSQIPSGPNKLNHGPAAGWGLPIYSPFCHECAMAPS